MKKGVVLFGSLLFCYVIVLNPLINHLQARPFIEKLGYTPEPEILKLTSADQKLMVGASLIMKVLMYYGSLVTESMEQKKFLPPDYDGMKKLIHGAVSLDPYNMDAYYFAEATLVWDIGEVEQANALLEEGMKYRDWDFYLPLFAGFNYAYFLKDYEKAAYYYKRAGELSGAELYVKLAGRYFYEAGHTELAIAFLTAMVKSAKTESIRKTYELRLDALKKIHYLEIARNKFKNKFNRQPLSLEELKDKGFVDKIPADPYGGSFYIDKKGEIRTTSKLVPQ